MGTVDIHKTYRSKTLLSGAEKAGERALLSEK
jgi:hypothetical protein